MRPRATNQLSYWVVWAIGEGLESYGLPHDGYRAWLSADGNVNIAIAPKHECAEVGAACDAILGAIQAWIDAEPSFTGQPILGDTRARFEDVVTPFLAPHAIAPSRMLIRKTPVTR